MAGQARRGTRGQGRSSRDDSSWPVLAVASAAVSGSGIVTSTTELPVETQRSLATRSTYRHLLMKGMAPEEAANLTAYLAGIPVGEAHWTLKQINQLLFLRQMRQTGRFGDADGNRTH
jgi:NAD(P)H-hydrate repair Nnr-like enzyme with NAD(P)H-hydrate dehydratase domain